MNERGELDVLEQSGIPESTPECVIVPLRGVLRPHQTICRRAPERFYFENDFMSPHLHGMLSSADYTTSIASINNFANLDLSMYSECGDLFQTFEKRRLEKWPRKTIVFTLCGFTIFIIGFCLIASETQGLLSAIGIVMGLCISILGLIDLSHDRREQERSLSWIKLEGAVLLENHRHHDKGLSWSLSDAWLSISIPPRPEIPTFDSSTPTATGTPEGRARLIENARPHVESVDTVYIPAIAGPPPVAAPSMAISPPTTEVPVI